MVKTRLKSGYLVYFRPIMMVIGAVSASAVITISNMNIRS
jgi:hypothetical protein